MAHVSEVSVLEAWWKRLGGAKLLVLARKKVKGGDGEPSDLF